MKAALALTLACACLCFGDIRLFTSVQGDPSPAPLFRTDNTAIGYFLNQGMTANLQSSLSGSNVTVISTGSDPVAAVRAAMATWNAVATANVHFVPLQSTATGINAADDTNVIAVASTADQLSALGGANGALAVTFNSYSPQNQQINGVQVTKGAIFDSDIVVNPSYAFSTDGSTPIDLQSVITHELGHALGANHATLVGTLMYWRTSNQRFLSSDEVTLVSTAYPAPGDGLGLGTLTGTVTAGGQAVAYGMVSMIDLGTGVSAGTLTGADGTYSVLIPAGNYQLLVEPLGGNIYLTAAQTAQAAAIAFQPTLAPGLAALTAGATVTSDVAVTTGSSALSAPLVAVTGVNGRVGTGFPGGPAIVQSGQSVDLVLAGAGYDATLNPGSFQVFGPGMSVGAVRVDRTTTFNGVPILRVTLAVASSASQFLATVFISNGTSAYSLTGALVVTPPAPAFTSKSVVSAASYVGVNGDGAVSPGGIYSLYAAPNSSNLGPATPVNNGGFDPYGLLSTNLAGVSVTFDGVPAPLFFVAGGQINFQAPFSLAGKKTTQVVVHYLGSTNSAVTVPVVAAQPAFFTGTPLGTDSRVVNQDGVTLNTAQTPEAAGNYVTIYGTGVGNLSACANATGAGAPGGCTAAETVTVGGQPAAGNFYFAGWTPTSVGLAQWTVQIPANAASGAQTVVATDTATSAVTPKGTIYVK